MINKKERRVVVVVEGNYFFPFLKTLLSRSDTLKLGLFK
jgi:hypothetical protein